MRKLLFIIGYVSICLLQTATIQAQQNDLFNQYPWLTNLVNPSSCTNEKVEVYEGFIYDYILVTDANGIEKMYNTDGLFYCQNATNYDCIAAYRLNGPATSWTCGTTAICDDTDLIRRLQNSASRCYSITSITKFEYEGNNYYLPNAGTTLGDLLSNGPSPCGVLESFPSLYDCQGRRICDFGFTVTTSCPITRREGTIVWTNESSECSVDDPFSLGLIQRAINENLFLLQGSDTCKYTKDIVQFQYQGFTFFRINEAQYAPSACQSAVASNFYDCKGNFVGGVGNAPSCYNAAVCTSLDLGSRNGTVIWSFDEAIEGTCSNQNVTIANTQCRRIGVYDESNSLLTTMDSGPFGNAPVGTPTPVWTDPTPLAANEERTYILKEGDFILARKTVNCENNEITTSNSYAAGCNDGLSLGIYTNTGCRAMSIVNTNSDVIEILLPGESRTMTATNFIYIFLVGNDTIDIKSDVGGNINSGGCGNNDNDCSITITNIQCRTVGVYDETGSLLTTMAEKYGGPPNPARPDPQWTDPRPLANNETRTYIFKENNLVIGRQTASCAEQSINTQSNFLNSCTDALGLEGFKNAGCRELTFFNNSRNEVAFTLAPDEERVMAQGLPIPIWIVLAGRDTVAVFSSAATGGFLAHFDRDGGCGTSALIFEEYPWVTDLVNSITCTAEKIEVYQTGVYKYLLVTSANGEAKLYNQDGLFYCQNAPNYDCVAAYSLERLIDSWNCEGEVDNINRETIYDSVIPENFEAYDVILRMCKGDILELPRLSREILCGGCPSTADPGCLGAPLSLVTQRVEWSGNAVEYARNDNTVRLSPSETTTYFVNFPMPDLNSCPGATITEGLTYLVIVEDAATCQAPTNSAEVSFDITACAGDIVRLPAINPGTCPLPSGPSVSGNAGELLQYGSNFIELRVTRNGVVSVTNSTRSFEECPNITYTYNIKCATPITCDQYTGVVIKDACDRVFLQTDDLDIPNRLLDINLITFANLGPIPSVGTTLQFNFELETIFPIASCLDVATDLAIGTFECINVIEEPINNNQQLFNTYPWLSNFVNPNNCSTEQIAVFQSGIYTYLLVTDASGKATLYNEDGLFYCQNSSGYDCVAAYNLGTPINTWMCAGTTPPASCNIYSNIPSDTDLCEACYKDVSVYEYQGENYIVYRTQTPDCRELELQVVNCATNIGFCVAGPNLGLDGNCPRFFAEATLVETLWTDAACTNTADDCDEDLIPFMVSKGDDIFDIDNRRRCYNTMEVSKFQYNGQTYYTSRQGPNLSSFLSNGPGCGPISPFGPIYDCTGTKICESAVAAIPPNYDQVLCDALRAIEQEVIWVNEESSCEVADPFTVPLIQDAINGTLNTCTTIKDIVQFQLEGFTFFRLNEAPGTDTSCPLDGASYFSTCKGMIIGSIGEFRPACANIALCSALDLASSNGNGTIIWSAPATTPNCNNYTGTIFFRNCDDGTPYYFLETDDGRIFDPYFTADILYNPVEGQKVNFDFTDANFNSPCSIAEKAINITCIEAADNPTNNGDCTQHQGTIFFENCDDGTEFFFIRTNTGLVLDIYFAEGINFVKYPGQNVNFDYVVADFNSPCSVANQAVIVTCIADAGSTGGNENPALFTTYPWLGEYVTPANCNGESVFVYPSGTYQYVFIESASGGQLFFQDGTFYCQDSPGYDCRAAYNLTTVTDSWACANFQESSSEERSKIAFTPLDFTAFPNPTTGHLRIQTNNTPNQQQLRILDLLGRVVVQEEIAPYTSSVEVDLSAYKNGVYYVEVRSKGLRVVKKVIKQDLE